MTISERIFELMKKKEMTGKEFSKRTGIPQSTISDWKHKKMNPSSEKIMLICDVLDVTPYELLSGVKAPRCKDMGYVIVDKNSSEYFLLENYSSLNNESRNRLLGYLQALLEIQK